MNANEISTYEVQANELLNSLGVTFKAEFLKHDYHFHDDFKTRKMRDIFKCIFKRGRNQFSIIFGQSLNDSTGTGKNKPSAYDVVACLQKYDVGTFENFCSEFGYPDTPQSNYDKAVEHSYAKSIYKGVVKEYQKVCGFFTPSEIELLQEVQ